MFCCLKCKFSLNSLIFSAWFTSGMFFFSFTRESASDLFQGLIIWLCSFRRGIWEHSIAHYIDSKQDPYFQSYISPSSSVVPGSLNAKPFQEPLRQVPLVSAGTGAEAYSAIPVTPPPPEILTSVEMRSSQDAKSSSRWFPSVVSCSLWTYILLFLHCDFMAVRDREEILLKSKW